MSANQSSADEPDLDVDLPTKSTERAPLTRRTIIVNTLRYVLLALVIVASVWQLWVNWEAVLRTVTELQWQRVVIAFLAALAGIGFSTLSWIVIVDDLGKPIGVGRGGQIFLVGQLGKYLPGSIWAYVLQIELGRKAGLARARVFASTVFSLAIILVAALIARMQSAVQRISDLASTDALTGLLNLRAFEEVLPLDADSGGLIMSFEKFGTR